MRVVGVDWETTRAPTMHPWQAGAYPVLFGMAYDGEYVEYVFNHVEADPVPQADLVRQIQGRIDAADLLVAHNMKFDLNWMSAVGIDTSRVRLYCTQVAEYIIRGQARQEYSLEYLSRFYRIPPKVDRVKTFWEAGYQTDEIPLRILSQYLRRDCTNTLLIYRRQRELIRQLGLGKMITLEMEKLRVLSDIERNGMRVNREQAMQHVDQLRRKLEEIDREIYTMAGREYNLSSPDELSAMLYGGVIKSEGVEEYEVILKSGVRKRKTRRVVVETPVKGMGFKPPAGSALQKPGYYSTSKDTLARLRPRTDRQSLMLVLLQDRSKVQKALETFLGEKEGSGIISKICADGCIHPQFLQTVTRTGRLSSISPNGQNIPRKGTSPVKSIFIPKYDLIGNADLSQLEWRVAAYLSQDPVAIHEIKSGVDYHRENAIKFFGDAQFRTDAKVFGFRLLYGGTAYGMFMDSKMPKFPLSKWERIVEEYYTKYSRLRQWQTENIAAVIRNKGWLRLPSGRILTFDRREGTYSEKQIKNYPVQAFATADIMPLAMVVIAKRMRRDGYRSHMICQVHDSIVFDVVRDELDNLARLCVGTFRELPDLMRQFWGIDFNVPLDGEFEAGPDYGSLSKYDIKSPDGGEGAMT